MFTVGVFATLTLGVLITLTSVAGRPPWGPCAAAGVAMKWPEAMVMAKMAALVEDKAVKRFIFSSDIETI